MTSTRCNSQVIYGSFIFFIWVITSDLLLKSPRRRPGRIKSYKTLSGKAEDLAGDNHINDNFYLKI